MYGKINSVSKSIEFFLVNKTFINIVTQFKISKTEIVQQLFCVLLSLYFLLDLNILNKS